MSGPLYKLYDFLQTTQMFTPTGQCAELILPLYQLCQGHWWGYESHSAIVLVVFKKLFNVIQYQIGFIRRYSYTAYIANIT